MVEELKRSYEAESAREENAYSKKLFQEVFRAIVDWVPTHKSKSEQATLLEFWWMLKLLESLREWELLNIGSTD